MKKVQSIRNGIAGLFTKRDDNTDDKEFRNLRVHTYEKIMEWLVREERYEDAQDCKEVIEKIKAEA